MPASTADRLHDRLLRLLVVSLFLPWMASFAVAGVLALLLWCLPGTRAALLSDKKALLRLSPWPFLALLPPLFYRNWLGLAAGGGVLLFFSLFLWLRAVLTRARLVEALRIACLGGVFAALAAVVQKIGYLWLKWPATEWPALPSNDDLRTPSFFGNPNEYAAVAVLLVLFGLWLYRRGALSLPMTCLTVGSSLVGLLLSASLMAMVSLFFALVVLLALEKRGWTLLALGGVTAAAGVTFWRFPALMAHGAGALHSLEVRLPIWQLALVMFPEAPYFGRGMLSYWLFSPDYVGQNLGFPVRVTTCAHSLLLDGLLSFGVVGIALVGWYLLRILRDAIRRRRQGSPLPALTLACLTAAAVHGLFDVTAVWPPVAILLALAVAAGVGPLTAPGEEVFHSEPENG